MTIYRHRTNGRYPSGKRVLLSFKKGKGWVHLEVGPFALGGWK